MTKTKTSISNVITRKPDVSNPRKSNCETNLNYKPTWTIYMDTLTVDTLILVEEYTFHAHKDILSYYSPVLRNVLRNEDINKVTVKNIRPKALQILLNYMYTNNLKINCQNIIEIYAAAQKLKMKSVIAHCIKLFTTDEASSYIYRYAAAWELGMIVEKSKAYKLIMKNLDACVETKEFFDLHIGQISEIFVGASIDWIESDIQSYFSLFLAALKWIEEDRSERIRYAVTVMTCVPFQKMKKEDIIHCFTPPIGGSIIKLQPVRNILISVLQNVTGQQEAIESFLKANEAIVGFQNNI